MAFEGLYSVIPAAFTGSGALDPHSPGAAREAVLELVVQAAGRALTRFASQKGMAWISV